MRNRVAAAEPETRCPDSEIGKTYQCSPDDQVALISRKFGGPFSRHLDLVAVLDHRQVDPFPPVKSKPEAVKARPQVGAGGRDLDRHRPAGDQNPLATGVRTQGLILWIPCFRHLFHKPTDRCDSEQISRHDFGMDGTESRQCRVHILKTVPGHGDHDLET